MEEKRDQDMAVNKATTPKTTTVSSANAMAAAKRVLNRHRKSLEKLAKS